MKITTEEIYKLADEITDKEIENVLGAWSQRGEVYELDKFKQLVRLGDSKAVALFTVIAEKYNNPGISEMYNLAYNY